MIRHHVHLEPDPDRTFARVAVDRARKDLLTRVHAEPCGQPGRIFSIDGKIDCSHRSAPYHVEVNSATTLADYSDAARREIEACCRQPVA